MRLVVTGGRDYADRATVFAVLDALAPTEIAHGGANGADHLAGLWAKERGIPCVVFPCTREEWNRYGKRAGHLRNERMLVTFCPELVIAFPGGRGTANCIEQALRIGIRVRRVESATRKIVVVHSRKLRAVR